MVWFPAASGQRKLERMSQVKRIRKITATALRNYVWCPRQVQLNLIGDPELRDPLDLFLKRRFERGNAYEKHVVEQLGKAVSSPPDALCSGRYANGGKHDQHYSFHTRCYSSHHR